MGQFTDRYESSITFQRFVRLSAMQTTDYRLDDLFALLDALPAEDREAMLQISYLTFEPLTIARVPEEYESLNDVITNRPTYTSWQQACRELVGENPLLEGLLVKAVAFDITQFLYERANPSKVINWEQLNERVSLRIARDLEKLRSDPSYRSELIGSSRDRLIRSMEEGQAHFRDQRATLDETMDQAIRLADMWDEQVLDPLMRKYVELAQQRARESDRS